MIILPAYAQLPCLAIVDGEHLNRHRVKKFIAQYDTTKLTLRKAIYPVYEW